jgi:hypothetical protein
MITQAEVEPLLEPGESLASCLAADGAFASKHDFHASALHVAITSQRLVLLSHRGAFRKRAVIDVSWPLTTFTTRVNSNEGTALGPFMHFLTLFTRDEETVSVAFKSAEARDHYKTIAASALAQALDN